MNNAPKVTVFLLLAFSSPLFAATNFYSLQERWEKRQATGETQAEAVESGFQSALSSQPVLSPAAEMSLPPQLSQSLSEALRLGNVDVELRQTLLLKSPSPIVKFVSTAENKVILDTVQTDILRIIGTEVGQTFLHVWDASGRNTFQVTVLPPKLRGPSYEDKFRDTVEKTRPFKVTYRNSRNAFYTGPRHSQKERTSLDIDNDIYVEGDTPYGYFLSHAKSQRAGLDKKHILTDMQAKLVDGQIGAFRDFDLTVGDAEVRPRMMAFSSGRIRGVDLQHETRDERVRTQNFYGREQTSLVGTISPGFGVQERTKSSFLSGHVLDFKMTEDSRWRGGFFTGHGRDRQEELHRTGLGIQGATDLGRYISWYPEYDHDRRKSAHRQDVRLKFENLTIRGEYRDINKNYQSMLGFPSSQGELGYLLEAVGRPAEWITVQGSLDLFRDRRIPNPDDVRALNNHTNFGVTLTPWDRTSVLFNYQNMDDTGRVGPTRDQMMNFQWNQGFNLWTHRATLALRYQHRNHQSLTSEVSAYDRDLVSLGLYTKIFWDIDFSAQKEWSWLDEYNADRFTRPEAMTVTFSHSKRAWNTPVFLEGTLRYRDEEETESPQSFMIGEDTLETTLGVYYREYENLELFLTGRFARYFPESANIEKPRMEAQFLTGMRYTLDTGFRWTVSGDLRGHVFKDLNADGVRQPEEPGIEGIEVLSGGKRSKTDAEGAYAIKAISGRRFAVVLDTSNLPYGFVPTDAVRRELERTDNVATVDFGLVPRSEVNGLIFNDLDGNGQYDLTDAGVKGVRVILEDGTAARSNALGAYTLPGVVAGEHEATLDIATLPEGYLPQGPHRKKFTLFEGLRYELRFPLTALRALTGTVYSDVNRNGFFDADETALAGVEVSLGGQSIRTDENGRYLFDNLKPGTYELSYGTYKQTFTFEAAPKTLADVNIPAEENREV